VLGTLIGCAIALASGTSRALSCGPSLPVLPQDGATDVPTNTLLWSFRGSFLPALVRVLGPGGEVAVEERWLRVLGEDRRSVLRPLQELAPNSPYTVEITGLDAETGAPLERSGGADHGEVHFTTAAGPLLTPPELPRLLSQEAFVRKGWSGLIERSVALSFEPHTGILIGDADAAAGAATGLEDLFEAEPAVGKVTWATLESYLDISPSLCTTWPEGVPRVDGRFAVLDIAGNFSGWLAGVELALPSDDEVAAFAAANPEPEPERVPSPVSPHVRRSPSAYSCQLGIARSAPTPAPLGAGLLLLAAAAVARSRRGRQRAEQLRSFSSRAAPGRAASSAAHAELASRAELRCRRRTRCARRPRRRTNRRNPHPVRPHRRA